MKHYKPYTKYEPKHLAESTNDTFNEHIFIPIAYIIFALLVLHVCICAAMITNAANYEAEPTKTYQQVEIEDNVYISNLEFTLESSDVSYSAHDDNACEIDNQVHDNLNTDIDVVVPFEETFDEMIGQDRIGLENGTLIRYDLPDKYYPGIDYSSFQPYMPYTAITNKSAAAYWVVHSNNCYTDEYGLRRYKTTDSQFTINGQDDYVIALGNFYKEKGSAGGRYLIVTTTGMYTAIIGDEKDDRHTDKMNMFSSHCNGSKAGLIEWIVDNSKLNSNIKLHGTVTAGGPEATRGEILHIYEIV